MLDLKKQEGVAPTLSTLPAFKWTEAEEKRIRVKFDLRILPLVTCFQLLGYINRVLTKGHAKISNEETGDSMMASLELSGAKFATMVSCFYASYLVFQVPLNLVFKKIKPSVWASACMLLWGLASLLSGFSASFGGLLVCRIVLGIAQSGFVPGMVSYICSWYKPSEHAFRLAVYLSSSSAAGAICGCLFTLTLVLAFAISRMNNLAGLKGWQWILVLEAIPTILFALIAYFILPNSVKTCKFLTLREKEIQQTRLPPLKIDRFDWKEVYDALSTPRIWIFSLMGALMMIPANSFSFFAPTQISNMGFTSEIAQFLSAFPYILAIFTSSIYSWNSDRTGDRKWHLTLSLLTQAICLLSLAMFFETPVVKVVVTGIAINAAIVGLPVQLAWNNSFIADKSSTYKATAVGLVISCTNFAGITSPYLYTWMGERGHLKNGQGVTIQEVFGHVFGACAVSISFILVWIVHFFFKKT